MNPRAGLILNKGSWCEKTWKGLRDSALTPVSKLKALTLWQEDFFNIFLYITHDFNKLGKSPLENASHQVHTRLSLVVSEKNG